MSFIKRLYDLGIAVGDLDDSLENNITNEIRKAIPRGIILFNYKSDDMHNPLDRQIEIYTYVKLKDVNQSLNGIAKMKVACRLSSSNGTLSLRTIDKNFVVD